MRFDRVLDRCGNIEPDRIVEVEDVTRFGRFAVDADRTTFDRCGDMRARKTGPTRECDIDPDPRFLGAYDEVLDDARSPRNDARIRTATPTVMHESATLKTFGQIVLKSMKSTTK